VPTILVVEDSAQSRKPLVKLLQLEGYKVIPAVNAFEAMAGAKKSRPDLVLLDVMIPPMDGLTFLMLFREDPHGRDVPVILVTGLQDDNTIARARDLGVKEYLVKSQFTPDELLSLIRKHLPHELEESVGDSEAV
jgi:twitching motility two-component system response regulator PilG